MGATYILIHSPGQPLYEIKWKNWSLPFIVEQIVRSLFTRKLHRNSIVELKPVLCMLALDCSRGQKVGDLVDL